MVTKIGIVGSCVSDDVFRTPHNYKWRDDFQKEFVVARTSIISLAQNSLDINKEELNIQDDTQYTNHNINCMYGDFIKWFWRIIKQNNVDYLIIDLYFDVIFGALVCDDAIVTNNHWHLPLTPYYNKLSNKKVVTLYDNPDEYMVLFEKYSDVFFKMMKEQYPKTKILINSIRITDKKKVNNEIITISDYDKAKTLYNPCLEKLENYLCENYDVELIDFEDTYLDDNHIWGSGMVHYSKEYYQYTYRKILKIIQKDLLNNIIDDLNNKISELQNENKKLTLQIKELSNIKEKVSNSKYWKLTEKYHSIKQLF